MRALFAVVVLLTAGAVRGAIAGEALTLEHVLSTSLEHFPRIQSAVEEKLLREGRLTRALGAFDLALEQESLVWADGFYDGMAVENRVVKRLPSANARVYSGYRISNDDFPIYQQELVTNDAGEFNLGVVFSLWRDRAIDEYRFAVSDAELGVREAEIELLLARVTTQRNAARAYWAWVVAGHRQRVYADLVNLARDRIGGLERRVLEGDVAEVYVVENQQNLLRREALLTSATRDLTNAAIELSLYLRDDDGTPLRPDVDQLPATFTAGTTPRENLPDMIERALGQRPELARIENLTVLERKRLLLAENELKPRVDLGFKAAHDIGDGSRSRNGFDAIVDLQVSIPLERRRGRGQVAESRARLRQLAQDRRLARERLSNEVARLDANINAARELVSITAAEVEQAERMVDAERKRFAAGASDFFLVNVREERSADARARNLESRLRFHHNLADLYAITLDFAALGI